MASAVSRKIHQKFGGSGEQTGAVSGKRLKEAFEKLSRDLSSGGVSDNASDASSTMAGRQWDTLLGQLSEAGLVTHAGSGMVVVKLSAAEAKAAVGEEAVRKQLATVCSKLKI